MICNVGMRLFDSTTSWGWPSKTYVNSLLVSFPICRFAASFTAVPLYWRVSSVQRSERTSCNKLRQPWKALKVVEAFHRIPFLPRVMLPDLMIIFWQLIFWMEKPIKIKLESNNPSVLLSEDHQSKLVIRNQTSCSLFFLPYMLLQLSLLNIINTPNQKSEEMWRDVITGLVISTGTPTPYRCHVRDQQYPRESYAVDTWQSNYTYPLQRLILRASTSTSTSVTQKWINPKLRFLWTANPFCKRHWRQENQKQPKKTHRNVISPLNADFPPYRAPIPRTPHASGISSNNDLGDVHAFSHNPLHHLGFETPGSSDRCN